MAVSAARPRTRPDGWRGARALEVGTGSGYQAAVLSELGADLVSIERHADLSRLAGEALLRAGYPGVRLVVGDGTAGAPEYAPYDAVHHLEEVVAGLAPAVHGLLAWVTNTFFSALLGALIGAVVVAVMHLVPRRRAH